MAFLASPVHVIWGEAIALNGECASYGGLGEGGSICSESNLAMESESKGLL